jgi:hypothetical protein
MLKHWKFSESQAMLLAVLIAIALWWSGQAALLYLWLFFCVVMGVRRLIHRR